MFDRIDREALNLHKAFPTVVGNCIAILSPRAERFMIDGAGTVQICSCARWFCKGEVYDLSYIQVYQGAALGNSLKESYINRSCKLH